MIRYSSQLLARLRHTSIATRALAGMLVDGDSSRMTPSHAAKKSTRYRYYVSRPLITKDQTRKYEGSARPLSSSWAEFAADSTLEGAGFEPSVPQKAPGVLVVSVLARAEFSVDGESSRGELSRFWKLGRVTRYRRFESGFLQR